MPCLTVYATAQEYDTMMCAGADLTNPSVVADIETKLEFAAADVNAALASVGACGCTFDSWALMYLKKLNVIDAAVIQQCPCGSMRDEFKAGWLEWLNGQFDLIRTGRIVVCQGETSSVYPAIATVQQSWTDWSEAEMIVNRSIRELGE